MDWEKVVNSRSKTKHKWKSLTMKVRSPRSTPTISQLSFEYSDMCEDGYIKPVPAVDSHSSVAKRPRVLRKLSRIFKLHSTPNTQAQQTPCQRSRQLFGKKLTEVCSLAEDVLPQQLTELIWCLYDCGPSTCEIFRKSASAKKCSSIVDMMDNGDLSWRSADDLHGLLLAAVLKRYLRELPDKLLDDNLYGQWASAIEDTYMNVHQRYLTVRRLIEGLPKPNQVLLKFLVSLLNRIADSCDMNLMTRYNLSVCLAPCLLWTKSADRANIEQASKTVPRLLQFMLENSVEVFGSDMKLLLHQKLASKVSRSLDSVLADSMPRSRISHQRLSIDSLDSIDGRCDVTRRHQSPSSLSRDSGLIINDCVFNDDDEEAARNGVRRRSRTVTISYESIDSELMEMENGSSLDQSHHPIKGLPSKTDRRRQLDKTPTSPPKTDLPLRRADIMSPGGCVEERNAVNKSAGITKDLPQAQETVTHSPNPAATTRSCGNLVKVGSSRRKSVVRLASLPYTVISVVDVTDDADNHQQTTNSPSQNHADVPHLDVNRNECNKGKPVTRNSVHLDRPRLGKCLSSQPIKSGVSLQTDKSELRKKLLHSCTSLNGDSSYGGLTTTLYYV